MQQQYFNYYWPDLDQTLRLCFWINNNSALIYVCAVNTKALHWSHQGDFIAKCTQPCLISCLICNIFEMQMFLCALNVKVHTKWLCLCPDFAFSSTDFFCILHFLASGISLDFDKVFPGHMLLHCNNKQAQAFTDSIWTLKLGFWTNNYN